MFLNLSLTYQRQVVQNSPLPVFSHTTVGITFGLGKDSAKSLQNVGHVNHLLTVDSQDKQGHFSNLRKDLLFYFIVVIP